MQFFSGVLGAGKSSESELAEHAYELLFALYEVSPATLLYVLPQLEEQLRIDDEESRMAVTRLLARMFSAKDSSLVSDNSQLWHAFLRRFVDVSPEIRQECVKHSKYLLIYHPEAAVDVAGACDGGGRRSASVRAGSMAQ